MDNPVSNKARKYSQIKYSLAIVQTLYLFLLLFLFQFFGISESVAGFISGLFPFGFLVILLYLLAAYLAYYALNFPFHLYGSFLLERRFSLSSQKIGDWLKDEAKSAMLSYLMLVILFGAFYGIVAIFPNSWWLVVSLFWIFFSLILARLMPVLIIPLFFKYRKLSDELLRQRIIRLADKMKVKILDVFEIDFSRKTLKANAAFVGWGKTRRVILADTLKDKYSYDEIEVILAHEFAHYRLKHIFKLIIINSLVTLLSFYIIFQTSGRALGMFGLTSISDIAAFPVIIMYMILFGVITQPMENYLSRRMETNADKAALSITGLKDAFVSTMNKLADQNLADRNPHPIIKFFFFDHPPIDERLKIAG